MIETPRRTLRRWTSRARVACAPCAGAVVLALLAGCGGKPAGDAAPGTAASGGPAGSEPAVAILGGEPVPYRAFERYLADASMEDEGGEQEATIKSRLLDQFIEEQLMLRAASRLNVAVSDAEVDGYLQDLGVTEGEADVTGGEGKEAFRDKVRQSLILQKVKDQAVLSKVQVTPGEVEDYFKKQPEAFRAPRSVVLRQILLDDKSLAERLASTLAAEPAKFETLAREHSVAPDRGQARMYTEEQLPVELRDAIFGLEEGRVSPVLEHAQRYLLFQLVGKMEAQEQPLKEVRRHIQMELFQQKGEQALQRYIATLKEETGVRVNRAVLPFEYSGEYRN